MRNAAVLALVILASVGFATMERRLSASSRSCPLVVQEPVGRIVP